MLHAGGPLHQLHFERCLGLGGLYEWKRGNEKGCEQGT
jgi:hypothetical protein